MKERKKWAHVNVTPEAAAILNAQAKKPDGLTKVKFASNAIVEYDKKLGEKKP